MTEGRCRCGSKWTGMTYAHCSQCHSTYASVDLFDLHRECGACYELDGVYQDNGVWNTAEGHEDLRRRLEKISAAAKRLDAKGGAT